MTSPRRHAIKHEERRKGEGLVPVLIKVQDLSRRLNNSDYRKVFLSSWNWIDAYAPSHRPVLTWHAADVACC